MMKKYIVVSGISIILIIILTISFFNGSFDVVKSKAVQSFNDLMINLEKQKEKDSWIIMMPDGTSKLALKEDGKSTNVSLVLDINPFLKAGLDVGKLPAYITYDLSKAELYINASYDNTEFNNNNIAIDNMYNAIISNHRDNLNYHHTLDHFGLSLENGNAFEYARNLSKNDKDIVMVLNPNIFLLASLDIQKLEGYIYNDVQMNNGIKEKKILKIFNIEEGNKCLIIDQGC